GLTPRPGGGSPPGRPAPVVGITRFPAADDRFIGRPVVSGSVSPGPTAVRQPTDRRRPAARERLGSPPPEDNRFPTAGQPAPDCLRTTGSRMPSSQFPTAYGQPVSD